MKALASAGVVTALAVVASASRAAHAGDQGGTIVEVARAAGTFKTLVAALEATGLDKALSGEGPFTVFAPTDDAFAALPAGTVEKLLADKPKLASILKLHVARGRRLAEEVVQYDAAGTLEGSKLSISVQGGQVRVNGALVVATDVLASNGVVHVIDRVLLPTAPPAPAPAGTLVAVARAAGKFKTLVAALETTGLDEALSGEGPFTVFAPTDDAFAALPAGTVEKLLADKPKLASILKLHVARGRRVAADLGRFDSLGTLLGSALCVDARDGVRIGGARVLKADIAASNGVVHAIDAVLLPPEKIVRFPEITASSLAKNEFKLPGDLQGDKNLCLVAFQRNHQDDVDTWLEWLAGSPLEGAAGFSAYELPTMNRMGKSFERFVDDGMRSGIPDKEARARTITLWTDKKAFMRSLEIKRDNAIQAILVDRDGNVLWRAEGRFTEEKGRALLAAVRGR